MSLRFTYNAYRDLLSLLGAHGYEGASYHNWQKYSRCVILRHDIDDDISHAVKFAKIEADAHRGGTYFVLLSSDAYNALSLKNVSMLRQIMEYGHEIGLHFDEMAYPDIIGDSERIREKILEEATSLGRAIGCPVNCVSMHRPSKNILEADIKIPGMINSYSKTFFRDFKYLSDSRCHYREPIEEIIGSEKYDRLHILTHAFWYHETELDMRDTLKNFVNRANYERYLMLRDNFTNLDEVLSVEDVAGLRESEAEA